MKFLELWSIARQRQNFQTLPDLSELLCFDTGLRSP